MIKRNEEFQVDIIDGEFPNIGIANYKDKIIKVKGTLIGERALVRRARPRKEYIEAKKIETIKESPLVGDSNCLHFPKCSGCFYQNMTYEDELEYKKALVNKTNKSLGLDLEYKEIVASPSHKFYRNKMEFTFGDEYKGGPLTLGLNIRGRFFETINIDQCQICDKDFSQVLVRTRDFFQKAGVDFYNRRSRKGSLRHLVVRKSLTKGQIMVNLVRTSQVEIDIEGYKDYILAGDYQGELVSILETINDGLADAVEVDEMNLIYGQDYIIEEINGLKFKISPFSFFQTNSYGGEVLYEIVRDYAGDIKDQVVFDLYSGTGTIAQIMADKAKEVYAIEIVEEAVEKAKENAKINKLDNIKFIAGDVFKEVDSLDKRPDLIIIDPPREGINPRAIHKIIDFNPDRFIYVSCNPKTLARDLLVFEERDYEIKKAILKDQFPRTNHVESVVLMSRK